jgi:Zn-dependent protease with chaperone function
MPDLRRGLQHNWIIAQRLFSAPSPKRACVLLGLFALLNPAFAGITPPQPGWNLFSPRQDIQLGREAQAQVERTMPVVHNAQATRYLDRIGRRLARSRYAGDWPFSFGLIASKSVNAFSLPGGPIYVNTGLFALTQNEAQLAGVLAHEMSHIVLRHGTHQASKANLVELPALLLSTIAGGSLLGQLARLGIGLGVNSVLLRFSREAEAEADYNAVLMMADAGYDPEELARFFERLETRDGRTGELAQFLSDHPNPVNRVKAIEEEIRQLPPRTYVASTGEFIRIQALVAHLTAPRPLHAAGAQAAIAGMRPSNRFREYRARTYRLSYPDNWEAFGDSDSEMVTIAPREALFRTAGGRIEVGYGVMVSYYLPAAGRASLDGDTDAVVRRLERQNPGMTLRRQRRILVDGRPALLTTLGGDSPYPGESETDALVTVARPQGLFYLVFIAPGSEFGASQGVFEQMLRSVAFTR